MCKQSSVTIPGFPPLKKPSALTKTPNYKYCSFDYLTHTWLSLHLTVISVLMVNEKKYKLGENKKKPEGLEFSSSWQQLGEVRKS